MVTAKICMAPLHDRVTVPFGLLRFIVIIAGQHLPPLEACVVPSGSIKAILQRGTFRPSPSPRELRKTQKESLKLLRGWLMRLKSGHSLYIIENKSKQKVILWKLL